MSFKIISNSPNDTMSAGQSLGAILHGGEILGLEGELGAGKTCFIQGLAKGLGVKDEEYVRSPTFTLINEYNGRIPLYHFDLYRLENSAEIENLGYEEYFWGGGVTAIEWFEKLKNLRPEDFILIQINIINDEFRELHFSCYGAYNRQKFRGLIEKALNDRKV